MVGKMRSSAVFDRQRIVADNILASELDPHSKSGEFGMQERDNNTAQESLWGGIDAERRQDWNVQKFGEDAWVTCAVEPKLW
jgi:hypothetical protein